MKEVAKRIRCKDGVSLSVQASAYHYCSPRCDVGPYYQVEVGYPDSEPPESWKDYFDGDWLSDDRCSSVYGYVPVSLVRDYVNSHGGLISDIDDDHPYSNMI